MDTTTVTKKQVSAVITPSELLTHWQGHRKLTRRIIEAFPEKEFFEYAIGGMRPFAAMVKELLAIGAPALRQIVGGEVKDLAEPTAKAETKAGLLTLWDEATDQINRDWKQISPEQFHQEILLFGKYNGTVWSSIFYSIDNEIHHRGQGYVYLRSLGIEPHPFYDR